MAADPGVREAQAQVDDGSGAGLAATGTAGGQRVAEREDAEADVVYGVGSVAQDHDRARSRGLEGGEGVEAASLAVVVPEGAGGVAPVDQPAESDGQGVAETGVGLVGAGEDGDQITAAQAEVGGEVEEEVVDIGAQRASAGEGGDVPVLDGLPALVVPLRQPPLLGGGEGDPGVAHPERVQDPLAQ